MTGTKYYQACYIIPHAKGHQVRSVYYTEHSIQAKYMINLANYRHEVMDPPLDGINDTRHGILLSPGLHAPFGASEVAFLHVSYLSQLSTMWLNSFDRPLISR